MLRGDSLNPLHIQKSIWFFYFTGKIMSKTLLSDAKLARQNIIDFIKDKSNSLDDRYNLFKECVDFLPIGRSIGDWPFTDRRHPIYASMNNPFEICRGVAHASFILECYLEEEMGQYIGYDEIVSIEDELGRLPSVKVQYFTDIVNALLDSCLGGTEIDW